MPVDPKTSMNSHAGHVKGKVEKLRKFMEDNKDGLTSRTEKRAEALMDEVTQMYTSMENKWLTQLMDKVQDETLLTELTKKLEDSSKMADDVVADITKMLKDYDNSLASASGGISAPVSAKSLKMEVSFKPTVLAASSNLEEFNAWQNSIE